MRKSIDTKFAYIFLSILIPSISFFLFEGRVEYEANLTLSIIIFCLILWVSEIAPLSMIAILGIILSVLFGINDIKDAFSGFSNPVILLMIGSFLLALAINKHGLDRRISMYVLSFRLFSRSVFSVLVGLAVLTFILSMWLSNTATTAMMLPIALGVLKLLRQDTEDFKLFSALFLLTIAYSASLGGIGTVVGSPTNLVGLGFLSQEGVHITFLKWSAFTLPIALLSLFFLLLYVWLKGGRMVHHVEKDALLQTILKERGSLGKLSKEEVVVGVVFLLAVFLWVLPSLVLIFGHESFSKSIVKYIPESSVAILCSSLLFLIPTNMKNFKPVLELEDLKSIDWDTVLLFAGGLSLGKLVEKSGLAKVIGDTFTGMFNQESILLFFLLLIVLVIVATEVISNTATAITFIPVVIYSLKSLNLDIVPPVMAVIVAASFAFVLPVSTPPNAIVYGTKMVPIRTMIKTGIILDIVGGVIIFIFLNLFRSG
ncbi:MAG: SLC13 family permease [Hydrogenothermaceae bacterium]|nr:SLC13 family permease [Hydrogenothermaceae bacterium]